MVVILNIAKWGEISSRNLHTKNTICSANRNIFNNFHFPLFSTRKTVKSVSSSSLFAPLTCSSTVTCYMQKDPFKFQRNCESACHCLHFLPFYSKHRRQQLCLMKNMTRLEVPLLQIKSWLFAEVRRNFGPLGPNIFISNKSKKKKKTSTSLSTFCSAALCGLMLSGF